MSMLLYERRKCYCYSYSYNYYKVQKKKKHCVIYLNLKAMHLSTKHFLIALDLQEIMQQVYE